MKSRIIIGLVCLFSLGLGALEQVHFEDNFNRPNSTTVSFGWNEIESSFTHVGVVDNRLRCKNSFGVSGSSGVTRTVTGLVDGFEAQFSCLAMFPESHRCLISFYSQEEGERRVSMEIYPPDSFVALKYEGPEGTYIAEMPSFLIDQDLDYNILVRAVSGGYEGYIWEAGTPRPDPRLILQVPHFDPVSLECHVLGWVTFDDFRVSKANQAPQVELTSTGSGEWTIRVQDQDDPVDLLDSDRFTLRVNGKNVTDRIHYALSGASSIVELVQGGEHSARLILRGMGDHQVSANYDDGEDSAFDSN